MRAAIFVLLAGGCAAAQPSSEAQPEAQSAAVSADSPLPGTIGILVKQSPAGLVVTALRPGGPAARAGVREGDVIVSYNGVPVSTARAFNTLVTDSRPGGAARVELLRGGKILRLEIPIREVDTMPRV